MPTSGRPSAVGAVPDIGDAVADAFAQVLERSRESITAESDFFDLGGNSIRAAQVVARLRGAVPVKVMMRDLFRARTAGVLVAVLLERTAAAEGPRAGAAGPVPGSATGLGTRSLAGGSSPHRPPDSL